MDAHRADANVIPAEAGTHARPSSLELARMEGAVDIERVIAR